MIYARFRLAKHARVALLLPALAFIAACGSQDSNGDAETQANLRTVRAESTTCYSPRDDSPSPYLEDIGGSGERVISEADEQRIKKDMDVVPCEGEDLVAGPLQTLRRAVVRIRNAPAPSGARNGSTLRQRILKVKVPCLRSDAGGATFALNGDMNCRILSRQDLVQAALKKFLGMIGNPPLVPGSMKGFRLGQGGGWFANKDEIERYRKIAGGLAVQTVRPIDTLQLDPTKGRYFDGKSGFYLYVFDTFGRIHVLPDVVTPRGESVKHAFIAQKLVESGRAPQGFAIRIGGEFRYNHSTKSWVVNAASGRFGASNGSFGGGRPRNFADVQALARYLESSGMTRLDLKPCLGTEFC